MPDRPASNALPVGDAAARKTAFASGQDRAQDPRFLTIAGGAVFRGDLLFHTLLTGAPTEKRQQPSSLRILSLSRPSRTSAEKAPSPQPSKVTGGMGIHTSVPRP